MGSYFLRKIIQSMCLTVSITWLISFYLFHCSLKDCVPLTSTRRGRHRTPQIGWVRSFAWILARYPHLDYAFERIMYKEESLPIILGASKGWCSFDWTSSLSSWLEDVWLVHDSLVELNWFLGVTGHPCSLAVWTSRPIVRLYSALDFAYRLCSFS